MADGRRVIILAEGEGLPGEALLVGLLQERGYTVSVERDMSATRRALTAGALTGAVLVVDVLTAAGKGGLPGYEQFMRDYALAKSQRPLGMIAVVSPGAFGDRFAGWGTLVDAYVAGTPDPVEIASYVDRIFAGFDS